MTTLIARVFDPLPFYIEDALRASIKRFGVLVPITADQDGNVLDGHHRKRIAEELGISYETRIQQCGSDEERREIAFTLNADRRQISQEQRRAVAVELRKLRHSYRAIAGALGVDPMTVRRDVKSAAVADATADLPTNVIGLDGKVYPVEKTQDMPLLPTPKPRFRKRDREMAAAVRDQLAKNDGATFEAIAKYVGCTSQTVGNVAHELGINGKLRAHTRSDGKHQDVGAVIVGRISLVRGRINGIEDGIVGLLEKFGGLPAVRQEILSLVEEMVSAARSIKDALRKAER